MSAGIVASVDELTAVLLSEDDACGVCVMRSASDNVAPALLAKANQVAKAGVNALVVGVDTVAVERYRLLLSSYSHLDDSSVVSMRELCLRILSDSRVSEAVGRDARLLDGNEHDVLLEDMKVSGLKPRRLREMLKFFYRSISECEHEQRGWLINGEEQAVFAMLEENLIVRRAVLPCEAPSLAYCGLTQAGVELEPLVVLVDDYASLSKASQRLLGLLATRGLIAVASTLRAANTEESYPYYEGSEALLHDPAFKSIELAVPRAVAQPSFVALETPDDEVAYVTSEVLRALGDGVEPQHILVAVPNEAWAARIHAALGVQGIPAVRAQGEGKLKGDPRTPGRFAEIKLAAFLKLTLDAGDVTALRSWLGFGDWLLRSDAFLELMAFAVENSCSVHQAISALRTEDDAQRTTTIFGKFDGPLTELEELLCAYKKADRSTLVRLLAQAGMPLSTEREALLGTDEAHPDWENLALKAFDLPVMASDAVVIAPYRLCHGRTPRVAFVTGLVSGFMPAFDAVDDGFTVDHRRLAMAREQALFNDLCSLAQEKTVGTLFKREQLEVAGKQRMNVARVALKEGIRSASIIPSEFIPVA